MGTGAYLVLFSVSFLGSGYELSQFIRVSIGVSLHRTSFSFRTDSCADEVTLFSTIPLSLMLDLCTLSSTFSAAG